MNSVSILTTRLRVILTEGLILGHLHFLSYKRLVPKQSTSVAIGHTSLTWLFFSIYSTLTWYVYIGLNRPECVICTSLWVYACQCYHGNTISKCCDLSCLQSITIKSHNHWGSVYAYRYLPYVLCKPCTKYYGLLAVVTYTVVIN